MESVRKAKQRMRNYPLHLAKCSQSGAMYAACVARDLNVRHNICEKEFAQFKECIQKAAHEMKVKL